ncbi:MAG: dihydropteroate synthase [Elusimicrobia bacterium CG06_land_8_20_14_3_00_38_11]|nr:MAG: dihydropteroate synthase [Elusimicrobia bacterium CG06_land_8_20_14_3_00_38_11]
MTKIVGILNVTPDSFSDGGKFYKINDAVKHAGKLISEGADIIDVGGESSRPGSIAVSEDEEIKRVVPVIKEIKKKFPHIPISVDTYKDKVALNAIDAGAEIVNDIYGLRWRGGNMAEVVAEKKVTVIIMHMQGTPQDMQKNPQYEDVVSEIYRFFKERLKFAKSKGIKKERIIFDPGIGFGKTLQHNLMLLKNLSKFGKLGIPIMVGPSRKSFIGGLLNVDVSNRLEGTIASSIYSLLNGAGYLRVHDVLSLKRALTVFEAIQKASY